MWNKINVIHCKWHESKLITATDLHERANKLFTGSTGEGSICYSKDFDLRKHKRHECQSVRMESVVAGQSQDGMKASSTETERDRDGRSWWVSERAEHNMCLFVFESVCAWWCVPVSCDKSASMIKLQVIGPHCFLLLFFHFPNVIFLFKKSREDILIKSAGKYTLQHQQHESAVFSSLSHSEIWATKHQFVTKGSSRPQTAGQVVVGLWNNSVWQPVVLRKGHGQNQKTVT